MEKICIDTDVLIDIARRRLVRYVDKELNLCITFVTLYEYLRGLAYIGRDLEASKEELESRFTVLWLSNEAVVRASAIYSELRRKGQLIPDPDLLIGSICIVNEVPLATYNTEHYSRLIPFGLRLVKPEAVVTRIKERMV